MAKLTQKGRMPSGRNRKRSDKSDGLTITDAPEDLASLLRGLYRRVANQLNIDPSYVSRVARSERHSDIVADALRCELKKIIKTIGKRRDEAKKASLMRT